MGTLGVPVRSYKVWAAWAGEKAGRLKPNGHLTTRSPLSNLEELEILRLGVEGKAAGWRTLRALADTDARLDAGRLDGLISRARRQADFLEESRVEAARQVITAAGGHRWLRPGRARAGRWPVPDSRARPALSGSPRAPSSDRPGGAPAARR